MIQTFQINFIWHQICCCFYHYFVHLLLITAIYNNTDNTAIYDRVFWIFKASIRKLLKPKCRWYQKWVLIFILISKTKLVFFCLSFRYGNATNTRITHDVRLSEYDVVHLYWQVEDHQCTTYYFQCFLLHIHFRSMIKIPCAYNCKRYSFNKKNQT